MASDPQCRKYLADLRDYLRDLVSTPSNVLPYEQHGTVLGKSDGTFTAG